MICTTFDLQDIIKHWPILCLLPMCTIDGGISLVQHKGQILNYPNKGLKHHGLHDVELFVCPLLWTLVFRIFMTYELSAHLSREDNFY